MTIQDQLWDWDNLQMAYQNASRGKRGRGATAAFEYVLADNLLQLQKELREQTYQPGKYNSFYIHEPKKRLISAAPFRDRVVHHALCNVTIFHYEKRFIPESYANRVGKGTHRALDRAEQFAYRFPYVLQCDVKQFFPSIDHGILRAELETMFPDESALWLVDRILLSGRGVLSEEYDMKYFPGDDLFAAQRPRGLPIGNLTSQWWANCYLNPFDQFVKRELGCRAYLRYVDDFLLFSESKAQLWEWRAALIERLARYRLTIHEENALPRPAERGIPFLGFVIFPTHRLLKKRKGLAFQRRMKKIMRVSSNEQVKASVQGWVNHVRYGDTLALRESVLARLGLLTEAEHA
jgi:retron-type reverse transcriptase